MNPRIKKRLEAIEEKFSPHIEKSRVLFIPLEGETDQEMDHRIARWCAGEKVEGQDKLYTGGMVGLIKLVSVKP